MICIPFSGSKRTAYKFVKDIVENGDYNKVYEPFGGSCVLSVNLYNDKLVDKAVVNDYDHFFDLYPEYLDLKDKVVKLGLEAGLVPTSRSAKGAFKYSADGQKIKIKTALLYGKERETIQRIIKENVPEKYWRYFALGSNFCFSLVSSHEKVRLSDFCMFSRYLKTDKQRKYLEMLHETTLEHLDYKDFFSKHEKDFDENTLLIIDPPYPKTPQEQYKGMFNEEDTKEIIEYLNSLPCDYVYFHKYLDDLERWFYGIDYQIIELTSSNSLRKEYLIYVHKTH